MSEEIPSNEAYKPRSALGDVTNQVGKRGFSFISTSCVKSGDGCKKNEVFQSAKKQCIKVDGFKNENFRKENAECVLRPHSSSEINSLKGNVLSSVSKIACEIKEPCPLDPQQVSNYSTAVESGDFVRDNTITTKTSGRNSPHLILEDEDDERTDSVVVPDIPSKENDVTIDNVDSSKDEDLDCSRLLESQESRCGLERCIGQKGDGFSSMCMDLIKACPCSFCMKAAYLWSDLHYQDIKGRIAVIKKSREEASILVNQNSKDCATGRYGSENFEKSSNLESDLTGRWKSLFIHMEDLFVREGTQLETSLSTLKELRDHCKTDSEKN